MWLCVQCRMWKADFMSVGAVPGKGRVECLVCGQDVKTAGKYVRNAKQCICGGIVHQRCINQNTGALCECNLPQVLVHRFKKWQKSHNQATRQRRAAIVKQKREQEEKCGSQGCGGQNSMEQKGLSKGRRMAGFWCNWTTKKEAEQWQSPTTT